MNTISLFQKKETFVFMGTVLSRFGGLVMKKVLVIDANATPWLKAWQPGLSDIVLQVVQDVSALPRLVQEGNFAMIVVAGWIGNTSGVQLAKQLQASYGIPLVLMSHNDDERRRFQENGGKNCCSRLDLPDVVGQLLSK